MMQPPLTACTRRRRSSRRRPSSILSLLPLLVLPLLFPTTFVHASMGQEEARMYDRNLQHFSPEGRIYQVQYAERAAKRGSPVLALSNGKDALCICVERKRASALEDFISVEKVGEVQEGAFLGFAGLAADGRKLLDRTRLFAENYRLRHAELPEVKELALFVAELQHKNTFVRAHRPYGVACVLVGMTRREEEIDGGSTEGDATMASGSVPTIYATDPSGMLQEYRAVCVGENAEVVTTRLEAHVGELAQMSVGQLGRFAARALLDVRGTEPVVEGRGGRRRRPWRKDGADESEKDGEEREEEEEEEEKRERRNIELEVLLLTRKKGKAGGGGGGGVLSRRLFVKTRQEAEELGKLQSLEEEEMKQEDRREGDEL